MLLIILGRPYKDPVGVIASSSPLDILWWISYCIISPQANVFKDAKCPYSEIFQSSILVVGIK